MLSCRSRIESNEASVPPSKSSPKKGTGLSRSTRDNPVSLEFLCEECVIRALNALEKAHSLNRPFFIQCIWDAHASKLC